jgi:chromosomal replication initiator protein
LYASGFDHNGALLSVKTDLRKQIIEAKYLDLLSFAFESVMGFRVDITIVSEEEKKAPLDTPASDQLSGGLKQDIGPFSDYDYTFSTFIVGASNKFAHAASLAVSTNPSSSYNPLFIYGGSGLGKTHLLCAICNEIEKSFPSYNILYVKGEDFTNELINAIKTDKTKSFHDKYRQADVLLVDDIQFISGKESTQEDSSTLQSLYGPTSRLS